MASAIVIPVNSISNAVDLAGFVMSGGLSVLAAWCWARRLVPLDRTERLAAAIVLWVGLLGALQIFLGSLGLLRGSLVHALMVAGSGVALWRCPRPTSPPELDARRAISRGWLLILVGLGLTLLYNLIERLEWALLYPPFDGDSLLYHLPLVLDWQRTQSLLSQGQEHWFYPGHAELITNWLMVPPLRDSLAGLQNLPAYVLFGLGVYVVARRTGSTWPAALAVGLITLIEVRTLKRQLTTQETDLFVAAFFLAGLGWLMPPRSSKDVVLGGLALGIAVGSKYTGPILLLVAVAAGLVGVDRAARGVAARRMGQGMLIALVLGGFFYARNWLLAGSPVYPVGLTLGDFALFRPEPVLDRVAVIDFPRTALLAHAGRLEMWSLLARAMDEHWKWIPFAGLAGIPVLLLRRPGRTTLALMVVLLGTGLVLMTTPFTAENVPGTLNQLRSGYGPARFGLPFLGVAAATLAVALSRTLAFVGPAGRGRLSAILPPRWAEWLLAPILGGPARARGGSRAEARHEPARRHRWGLRGRWMAGSVLVWLLLVAAVMHPRVRDLREPRRYQLFAEALGPSLPRSGALEWFDANVRDQSVWVLGRASYPFAGLDLGNRIAVMDSARIRALDPDEDRDELARLPDVLVVSIVAGDPERPYYGRFPPIDAHLRRHPRAFPLLYEDAAVRIYGTDR